MEYVYSALLLHSAEQPVNEENVRKVLVGAGITPDDGKVKALVASLEGVNIEDAMKQAAMNVVAAAPAAGETKEEEPEEDDGKKAEEAAAGLSALFG